MFGYFAAAAPMVGPYRKPTPMIRPYPWLATRSMSSARFVPPEFGWSSFASMLNSLLALSEPGPPRSR
jgi:hypothetical protein